MKAVILAGGLGTRLSEETITRPKPMVEIGGMPILWHIMKGFSSFGVNDFIICCGYKGYVIKEFFSNYLLHMSDVRISLKDSSVVVEQNRSEQWTVTMVDTGEHSLTGGRLKRVETYVNGDECFCLTYGDGVGDVDIRQLINFHKSHGRLATLTATRPPGRYGALKFGEGGSILSFQEKPEGDGSWINGGFFVLNAQVLKMIEGDQVSLEEETLPRLAESNNLFAYKHEGFWQPMDTLREKRLLEHLWSKGEAPWKTWS